MGTGTEDDPCHAETKGERVTAGMTGGMTAGRKQSGTRTGLRAAIPGQSYYRDRNMVSI